LQRRFYKQRDNRGLEAKSDIGKECGYKGIVKTEVFGVDAEMASLAIHVFMNPAHVPGTRRNRSNLKDI
jgi:hypothetical protein